MIYNVPEVSEFFNEETIHVLDYQCEYDTEVDRVKFPEFNNKVWQFFNSDTSFTTGHFKFGDVESGATMTLKVMSVMRSSRPCRCPANKDTKWGSLSTSTI